MSKIVGVRIFFSSMPPYERLKMSHAHFVSVHIHSFSVNTNAFTTVCPFISQFISFRIHPFGSSFHFACSNIHRSISLRFSQYASDAVGFFLRSLSVTDIPESLLKIARIWCIFEWLRYLSVAHRSCKLVSHTFIYTVTLLRFVLLFCDSVTVLSLQL